MTISLLDNLQRMILSACLMSIALAFYIMYFITKDFNYTIIGLFVTAIQLMLLTYIIGIYHGMRKTFDDIRRFSSNDL